MKLRDFPLLTDENLDADVVAHLRQMGFDVLDVVESGLQDQRTSTCFGSPRRKGEFSSLTTPTSEPWPSIRTSH